MRPQTLASAFQAALSRTNQNRAAETVTARDGLLLAALQRSVTGMDQIVQRRIGLSIEGGCVVTQ
jgi:hypothetical protein